MFLVYTPNVKAQVTDGINDSVGDVYEVGMGPGGPGEPWLVSGYEYIDIVYASVSSVDSTRINCVIEVKEDIPNSFESDTYWVLFEWAIDTDENPETGSYWPMLFNDLGVDLHAVVWWENGEWGAVIFSSLDAQIAIAIDTFSVSKNTVTLTFNLADVGNPESFYWVASASEHKLDPSMIFDKVPNTSHGTFPEMPELKLIKKYFPYYYFSIGEAYYPCSFYFDGDLDVNNNHENYDNWDEGYPPYYVYIHTAEDNTYFTVQYWLYYAYNPWGKPVLNHEHDWEKVYIVFDVDDLATPEEAEPLEVRYYYHWWVNAVSWSNVEKIDSHPIVYVAEGSHASYPSKSSIPWYDDWDEGIMLSPDDFNWILVKDSVDHEEVKQHGNTFCYLTFSTIHGEPQPEPKNKAWPKYYKGEGPWFADPAPWNRSEWFETRPGTGDVLVFGARGSIDLHVYDPVDRHVGINYETGEPQVEIPHVIFYPGGDGQYIVIRCPMEGYYKVEIIGNADGLYQFAAYRSVSDIIVYWKQNLNVSITSNERKSYVITPSMISIKKIFKPSQIDIKRRGAVQARTNITNIGLFAISKVEVVDEIPPNWFIKNNNSVSFSVYINDTEYGLQFKAAQILVEENHIVVKIDFSSGVEITDGKGNELLIYSIEPGWTLSIRYPIHPTEEVEPGSYTIGSYITVLSIPIRGALGGVNMTLSKLSIHRS
jgi:hypothetical protein